MNYTESDKSLSFMKGLLKFIAWLGAIACIVIGIINFKNYKMVSSLTYASDNSAKNTNLIYGFVYLIGGPILSILGYYISMFFVWVAFDIKLIRNAATHTPNSQILIDFSNKGNNNSNNVDNIIYKNTNNQ